MANQQPELILIVDHDFEMECVFNHNDDVVSGGNTGGGGGSSSSMAASLLEAMSIPPFLKKTYEMVEDPETDPAISWSDVTRMSFTVWDVNEFCKKLLPKYFRHNNLSSFITQLNIYGFKKVNSNSYEYANQWFQGGKRDLLKNIKRREIKKRKLERQDVQSPHPMHSKMEMELKKLRREHKTIWEEIPKLKQQQESMQKEIANVKAQLCILEAKQADITMK